MLFVESDCGGELFFVFEQLQLADDRFSTHVVHRQLVPQTALMLL